MVERKCAIPKRTKEKRKKKRKTQRKAKGVNCKSMIKREMLRLKELKRIVTVKSECAYSLIGSSVFN